MKTAEQREKAALKRRAKYHSRNATKSSLSTASVWEKGSMCRIYLNNIGLNNGDKCYMEATTQGMSVTRFSQAPEELDEILAGNAGTDLEEGLGIKDNFHALVEAIKVKGNRFSFQVAS